MSSPHLDTCKKQIMSHLAKTYMVKLDQSMLRRDNSKTSVGEGFRNFFGTVTESKLIEPTTRGLNLLRVKRQG